MKLSNAQKSALHDISVSPGKSGRFWNDLGHPAQTLFALKRRDLIRCDTRGYESSRQWAFWITEKGKKVLQEARDD